ncbi:hypothetical protein DYB31_014843 [Aphanomyces astaci]|uniref:Helitron helicase-like domain-containing protein n=1 Tax=Aphanomyces astaci TaxID=112090 RepID=A0A397FN74_APHAT|nr:hypothetical protein DYB31_014843 [Aphanomyces astaci]
MNDTLMEDFLMEFVPVQPPIIPEGPAILDVELNLRPFQPLDDPEALQDEIDFVEGMLDDIDLHPTLEPYPFHPLEDPTAIHGEDQFIEEALHDIDLGEDPPFLPQDPVQDAIQNLPCCLTGKDKMDPYVFPDSPEIQSFKDFFKQRNFIEHIRQYNAQFNFTPIGTNEVKHSGSDRKTYCIQGLLTHSIGPLQPSLNRSGNLRQPSFAQIYMHTSEEHLQHRRNMFPAFSSRYTATIQPAIDHYNPLPRMYATDNERLRRAEADGTSGVNLPMQRDTIAGCQSVNQLHRCDFHGRCI